MNLKGFRTFIGALVTFIPQAAASFGINLTENDTALINDTADLLISFAGLCLAIYGRFGASTPIFKSK